MKRRADGIVAIILTSRKHTLHKVSNVAENDSKALCSALLTCQRFDLNTLEYRLFRRIIWVFENGSI